MTRTIVSRAACASLVALEAVLVWALPIAAWAQPTAANELPAPSATRSFELIGTVLLTDLLKTTLLGLVVIYLLFFALHRAGYVGTRELLVAVETRGNMAAAVVVASVVLGISIVLAAILAA